MLRGQESVPRNESATAHLLLEVRGKIHNAAIRTSFRQVLSSLWKLKGLRVHQAHESDMFIAQKYAKKLCGDL